MNQNLIQISDTLGVVSDESGNINTIEKDNNSYNFKEILSKENDIEELKLKLENYKNKLDTNQKYAKCDKVMNVIILIEIILSLILLYISMLPINVLIVFAVLSYSIFKGITAIAFGTNMSRHKEKNELNANISELEKIIPTLESELIKIKEQVNYKVNNTNTDDEKINNALKNIDTAFLHNPLLDIDDNKVKVLKLTKNK